MEWSCESCTLVNKPSVSRCSACQARRPQGVLAKATCFVDCYLEAGQKASLQLEQNLTELGASIRTRYVSRGLTHLIYLNGNKPRSEGALKDGLCVVSPSWAEACRAEGRAVPEANHAVSFSSQADCAFPPPAKKRTLEPAAQLVLRSPSDSFFSSSQRDDDDMKTAQHRSLGCSFVDQGRIGLRGSTRPIVARHAGDEDAASALSAAAIDAGEESAAIDEGVAFTLTSGEASDQDAVARTLTGEASDRSTAGMRIAFSGMCPDDVAMFSKMIDATLRRNSQRAVDILTDPGSRATHLIVGSGKKRTVKVIFALLHQAHVVRTEFLSSALDGVWPDEHAFIVPGRTWGINEHRTRVFSNQTVFLDPQIHDPPRPLLAQVIELAGGALTRDQGGATVVVAAAAAPKSSAKSSAAKPGGRAPIRLSISGLFDSIERARLEP